MVESLADDSARGADQVSEASHQLANKSQKSSEKKVQVGNERQMLSNKKSSAYSNQAKCGAGPTQSALERQRNDEQASAAKVVYQIETIYVMDEKPFALQRAAKAAKAAAIGEAQSRISSSEKTKEKRSQVSPSRLQGIAAHYFKQIDALAKLSAVEQGQTAELTTKQRTNSSVLTTTTANQLGKASKEKVQRKRSNDEKRSQDITAEITGASGTLSSTAKNLLEEFEKDDTLEPNMTLNMDGKSKVNQVQSMTTTATDVQPDTPTLNRQRIGSDVIISMKDQTLSTSEPNAQSMPETRQNKKMQKPKEEQSGADREAQQARRVTEQAPRKNQGQGRLGARNNEKSNKLFGQEESKRLQAAPEAITLQNMKEMKQDKSEKPVVLEPLQLKKTESTSNPAKPSNQPGLLGSLSPRRVSLIDKFSAQDFFEGQPEFRVRFTEVVRKFNHELMKSTCQVMKGCKSWTAKQISDAVFELLSQILQRIDNKAANAKSKVESTESEQEAALKTKKLESISSSQQRFTTPHKSSGEGSSVPDDQQQPQQQVRVIRQITTSVSTLKGILNYCFQVNNYQKPDCLKDFLVASLLMQSKINVIVLLAGTSGTGKSTLASLLGTRLGISTVLSTDSVRHVMRNFLKEQDNPTLFCSTYEAGNTVSQEDRQNASENWITLKGYKQQCALVTKELAKVIDSFHKRNESLVVEGVHLTMSFLKEMMSKYPTCIPFVLYIKNKNKHGERFAVRAKHMTIDPRFNKYISNIQHIRTIQEYLLKKSEEILIPRIENHNVDRSVSLIQATIMRCLHRISEGGFIYDAQQKRATGIHKVVQSIQKHQLSSKKAQLLIHEKVNDVVDRVKMVETFLQRADQQGHFDPEIERKLGRYRVSTSFDAKTINIWKYGEFADFDDVKNKDGFDCFEHDGALKKRSNSIVNVMPVPSAADPSATLAPGTATATGALTTTSYEKLSKAEKKQIKRELLEFSKRATQQQKNKMEQRKNLIETEEDLEAKICEGSQASSILKDHRKKKEKQLGLNAGAATDEPKEQQNLPAAITQVAAELASGQDTETAVEGNTDKVEIGAISESETNPQPSIAVEGAAIEASHDEETLRKLEAKRIVSEQQKQNELNLLKEAVRRAEEQQMKEDSQQMKDVVKESLQKTKRNKSQEPAGKGGSEAGDISSGSSLEVMADDDDDIDRLREVTEVEGELNLLSNVVKDEKTKKSGGDSKRLIQVQAHQLSIIQPVNLTRWQDKAATPNAKEAKEEEKVPPKKKFEYKLEAPMAGSVDDLIKAVTTQAAKTDTNKLSQFSSSEARQQQHRKANHVEADPTGKMIDKKATQTSRRLKPKEKERSKRQSSFQQKEHSSGGGGAARASARKQLHTAESFGSKMAKKLLQQEKQEELLKSKLGSSSALAARDAQQINQQRQQQKQRSRKVFVSVDKRSLNSGSNQAAHSTRGDAHSLSDKHQGGASESEHDASDAQADAQSSQVKRKSGVLRKQGTQESQEESQSACEDINKTIEEEVSEYSQTIGSLVSYTINYMEKQTIKGAGQSSRHDFERHDVGHTDSESDDHSLLAEKEEDSHSSIDTIEEEVDLSSEGSDHEEQQDIQQPQQPQIPTNSQVDGSDGQVAAAVSAAQTQARPPAQPECQVDAQEVVVYAQD